MHVGAVILAAIMGVATVGSWWGSVRGVGLPEPTREPLSVREDSARRGGGGHGGRYLYGGGLHRGK